MIAPATPRSQLVAKLSRSPDRESFGTHLMAHAVGEMLAFGTTSRRLNLMKACPYCGQLPPKLDA